MTTKLAALKPGQQLAMGFLKTFTLEPKKSEIFRFTRAGDRIFGRYISRRTTKTRLSESARVLDANIIESSVTDNAGADEPGPIGVHSIFESSGMSEVAEPREENRYRYAAEIDSELAPPTPAEERLMLAIVRAIKTQG